MGQDTQRYDVVVIGGGGAGILAAIAAGRAGARTALCEKMPKLGKKVRISGNGRCNLTNDVVDHAVEWGIEATPLVWEGEPADAILAAAESEGADVIVIGSSGKSGVGRMLMGSVSDDVIRRAPVPVMVVRAPRERED